MIQSKHFDRYGNIISTTLKTIKMVTKIKHKFCILNSKIEEKYFTILKLQFYLIVAIIYNIG